VNARPVSAMSECCSPSSALTALACVLVKDWDFFEPLVEAFLRRVGIAVLDDISLIHRLWSGRPHASLSSPRRNTQQLTPAHYR